MSWSNKYKKSIDCNNPKGFSQKAHCAGKKKRNENIMKLSELKEAIRNIIRERSVNAISKALEFYKKNKHTDKKEPFIKLLKKLGKEKEALTKELDMKVSGMYKNAEYKGESVVNEGFATWEMSFADMNINGVKLSKKNKYKVKARNTVEAIKKAAKMAGLKGEDWVATQTNYLKKIG